jgi:uncharacterized protein YyaL (SSP411 family)
MHPSRLAIARWVASAMAALLSLAPLSLGSAAGENAATTPGGKKEFAYSNRLIDSNDPYLLLHAHNPVDWYPWGPEALAKAKQENKPIFVSVGYSTCYWCHVAERTIYSDPAIAKLMNDWFINIKVDREQRPDIDSVYMLATQLITGHGGWPNNVFLTPDLKPFFAGSYFPPTDDAFGRPGFTTILRSLHAAWTDQRQEVQRQADKIHQAMLQTQKQANASMVAAIRPGEWLSRAREAIMQGYDSSQGGIGVGPQKFPNEPALTLLLADYAKRRDPKVGAALTTTLDAMAFGGIHDHLGGGFHRYSTEPTWSIPHFEKMLYDNAQLLGIYAEAYRLTDVALYRQVAEDIATYVSGQMSAPPGGFYAAQDAEVDGREGASYVWTRSEIESVLGKQAAARFFQVYTLTPIPQQTGSALLSSAEEGVLRVRLPIAATLSRVNGKEMSQVLSSLAPTRAKLLAERDRRAQPARDEKIIVAWNAMTIDALVRSGEILHHPSYAALARRAAELLWKEAYDATTLELKHEIFRGRAQTAGYLDDYALLGNAFLTLSEVSADPVWRERAVRLGGAMLRRFSAGDTLATTVAAKDLLIPPPEYGDSTEPSGTSAAIELLSRLYAATGNPEFGFAVARALAHLSSELRQSPERWPNAVVAASRYPIARDSEASAKDASASAKLAIASSADHVHAKAVGRSAGDHDEITVTVLVERDYHVNANPASFDYLIPTTVAFAGVSGVRVTYPSATLIKPRFAPEGLKVYEGEVTIRAAAPRGAIAQGAAAGELRVQACTDEICLPPATLALPVELR